MTNSQVPFILVTGVKKTTEQLAQIASNYPNAIIFYKYTDSETGITESSIWAHGEEYKTGGSDAHYKISTINASANPGPRVSSANVTTGAIGGWTPSVGDFFIEKEILDDEGLSTEKAQYTAYVWSYIAGGSQLAWRALDGNYNAENVYFSQGFDRTEKWGSQEAQSMPTADPIDGMNLKEVFEFYLVKEKNPSAAVQNQTNYKGYHSTALPSWEISLNNTFSDTITVKNTSTDENAAASGQLVKVGTKFYVPGRTFTPSISCNDNKAGTSETITLGPAYVSGVDYGYWTSSSDVGDKTKWHDSLKTTDHVGHVHGNTHDFTISYDASYTSGSNTLSLVETKFSDSSGNATSDTKTGVTGLSILGRELTTTEGVNKVKYTLTVGNKWARSLAGANNSNKIPGIETIYLATNKKNEVTNAYKTISQSEKTISDSASEKTISDKTTNEWTVTAVNPIITNGIMFSSETKTNSSGAFYNQDKTTTQEILKDYISTTSGYWYFGFGQLNTATESGKNWTFTVPSGITISEIRGNNESSAVSWDLNFKTNSDSTLNFINNGNTYTRTCTAGASVIRVKWSKS